MFMQKWILEGMQTFKRHCNKGNTRETKVISLIKSRGPLHSVAKNLLSCHKTSHH